MKAAIYTRKSTDDNDRIADNKSVTRQVERARAFAEARGWTVAEDHVFVDDGISGADFKTRAGLLRMLNRLRDFDVIVMSELSRLGREQSQTSNVLADLYAKGKRVFFYLTNEELKFESALDKFMVTAISFGAELEREKASQRARDALLRKAEKGYVTGGVCYGYDNREVFTTNPKGEQARSHTEQHINEQEAEMVRGVFTMYADGFGLTRIAKTLNGDPRFSERCARYFNGKRPPSPVRGKRGTGSWAPTSLREMLRRERYAGRVIYGKFRKQYQAGTEKRRRQSQVLTIERPDLRIIEQKLWDRVQKRIEAAPTKHKGGAWLNRPDSGSESKYLLAGFLRCECCGASLVSHPYHIGHGANRKKVNSYVCGYAAKRGATVCVNIRHARMDEVDGLVLDAIEQTILTPDVVAQIVEAAWRKVRDEIKAEPDTGKRLQAELQKAERDLERYVALIATATEPPAVLLAEIAKREARIAELQAEIAERSALADVEGLDTRRLRREIERHAGRLKEAVMADVPTARAALRSLLAGPIWYRGEKRGGYTLRGESRIGPLLPTSPMMASPRGFEPRSPP